MTMTKRAFAVAGTQTGVGKTTVTIGLIRAFEAAGRRVQPFKVGPDFIDPTHHRAAAGRWSHNLDSWMLDRPTNRALFSTAMTGADVGILEGVMGLYDGAEARSEAGSTAEMAKLLGIPVVLVVDAWRIARSVAALVEGYVGFDPDLEVAGVVFNRVAGEGHAALLEEALDAADGPEVFGALPRDDDLAVPERHLGLHLAEENSLPERYIESIGDSVREHVDLERLHAAAVSVEASGRETTSPPDGDSESPRIGVAYDDAFCFYYRDNLDRLERAGGELVLFSPIDDPLPDDLDGLYLGGGYPEEAPAELAANRGLLEGLREFARSDGPIYAECGGLMLLGQTLETLDGEASTMAGVFPWTTRLEETPHLDYAEVEIGSVAPFFPDGARARGHFFHYSKIVDGPGRRSIPHVYEVEPVRGEPTREGFVLGRTLASYIHLHFASNPRLARSFVEACRTYRDVRTRE